VVLGLVSKGSSTSARFFIGALILLVSIGIFGLGVLLSNTYGAALVADSARKLHWVNATLGAAGIARATVAQAVFFSFEDVSDAGGKEWAIAEARHNLGGVDALVGSPDSFAEIASLHEFVDAGNARDFDALAAIVAPNFERHCPATPDVQVRSWDDFRAFLEQDLATSPDSHVTLHDLVAEGDRVAFWATYAATQSGPMGPFPPTGRRFACEFSGIFRIAQDRIAELRVTWDNVGILMQLGHLAPMGSLQGDD